jgi:hypothetical protein
MENQNNDNNNGNCEIKIMNADFDGWEVSDATFSAYVKRQQSNMFKILYFKDNWDYGELSFVKVLDSVEQLKEIVDTEKLRYFHGFMPGTQMMYYGTKDNEYDYYENSVGVKIISKQAPKVYLTNLKRFLPPQLWKEIEEFEAKKSIKKLTTTTTFIAKRESKKGITISQNCFNCLHDSDTEYIVHF